MAKILTRRRTFEHRILNIYTWCIWNKCLEVLPTVSCNMANAFLLNKNIRVVCKAVMNNQTMKHYKCNINLLIPHITTHHISPVRFLGSYRSWKIVIAGKSFYRIKCLTNVLEDRNWTPTNTPHPTPPLRPRVCVLWGAGILKQPGKYCIMPLLLVSISKGQVLRVLTKESSSDKDGVQYFKKCQE